LAQSAVTTYITQLQQLAIPRWADLPAFPVYAEQAADIVNKAFAPFGFAAVTTSDINYWVKQKVVTEASKKKFDQKGIAAIMAIAFFSEVYPLSDIHAGVTLLSKPAEAARIYDFFVLTTLNNVHRYATNFQQDFVIPGQTEGQIVAMSAPIIQIAVLSVIQKAIVHHALVAEPVAKEGK
jgi:hypothetical protein